MKFIVVSLFLTSLIGFLGLIIFYDLQSINSQGEITQTLANISVKITSPNEGKKIPSGELTISGISSDTQNKNCIVFVDWNDIKPFQKVRAAGPGGIEDFSEWIFTYDSSYHEIIAGNNELTSKITCLDGSKPLTKWNSINVTGYPNNSSLLSDIQQDTTSLESISKQLPLQTILPGSNQKNTTIPAEQNTTSSPLASVSSVEQNTTSSPLANLSESSVEMFIPNESIVDDINNTNTSISVNPQSTSNLKSKQLMVDNPRIDLDTQQPPQPPEDELSAENQTMVPPTENQTMVPPTENQTMVPPTENQTMVPPTDNQPLELQQPPPTLENQQQQQPPQLQPPTLDNETFGSKESPSLEEKSPTQGLFPPFQLPSLFP
ncbi:MAG TPA: hypothetical protein VHJ57_02695 [Nitrososphaeraceae archaeon]|nr:hypothetical protein [Nitrososphaeraceae archaeon]